MKSAKVIDAKFTTKKIDSDFLICRIFYYRVNNILFAYSSIVNHDLHCDSYCRFNLKEARSSHESLSKQKLFFRSNGENYLSYYPF